MKDIDEYSLVNWHISALRFQNALLHHQRSLLSQKFDPDQPRIPAGNPEGGQWTSAQAGAEEAEQFSAARRTGPGLEAACLMQISAGYISV